MVLIRAICLTLSIAALFLWSAAPFAAPMNQPEQPSHHGSVCPDCQTHTPCPDEMAMGCAACPAAIPAQSSDPWLAAGTLVGPVCATHPAHSPLDSPDHDPPPPRA